MRAEEATGMGSATYFEKSYGNRPPQFYAGLLANVVQQGKPGTLLDIGCGTGLFVELCRDWGLTASGCDGSEAAIAMGLARRPGLQVQVGLLSERLPIDSQSVDNVVMHQVIEHLPDEVLKNVLSESRRVLRKSGVLFIYSPSRADEREMLKDSTHIAGLLPSELRSLLEQSDFDVVAEPNSALRVFGLRLRGPLARPLLRTRLKDALSGTCNARAVRR